MNNKAVTIRLLLILFLSSNLQAYANTPVVPNNLDAGAIDKGNTDSIFNNRNYIPKRKLKTGTQKFNVTKSKPQKLGTKGVTYNPTFTVKEIVIDGNTIFKDKKLNTFFKEIIGKEISVAELLEVANKITEYYHSKGYITSRAYFTPQRIDDGKVELSIQEGKYGDIRIKGNKWAKERHLKAMLSAHNIKEDEPLNIHGLRNSINEINKSSYMKGKISVQEGAAEMSAITLDVEDRLPIDFNVSWDNEGREITGSQRAVMVMSNNNLTGYGDRLYGGAILGSRSVGAIGGYSIPIGKKGTRLNFGYSHSNTKLGGLFEDLGIEGYSHEYSVGLNKPLYRGKTISVDGNASFGIRDSKTKLTKAGFDLTDHRLSVLRTGVYARKDDFNGVWLANTNVSTGLPFFNATQGPEDWGYEDSKFVKVNFGVQRYQVLPFKSMGIFKANTQYTPNKLLAPEKLQMGGSTTVRGFEPGLLIGDCGFNGSFEIRTPVPFLKKVLPKKIENLADKTKLGYFYDFGMVRDIHNYNQNAPTNFMQSIGVGLHLPVTKHLTANLDLGIPIGGQIANTDNARFCFSITSAIHNLWDKNINNGL